MRPIVLLSGLLAACTTSLPESNPDFSAADGAGVGFGDYQTYQTAQDRAAAQAQVAPRAAPEIAGGPGGSRPLDPSIVAAVEAASGPSALAPGYVGAPPLRVAGGSAGFGAEPVYGAGPSPVLPPAAPAAATVGLPQTAAVTPAPLGTSAVAPAAVAQRPSGTPGISDEQDFSAVAERETIESDAARLERLRRERTVVEPEAVPQRPESTGPNIVQYALSTTNAVGQPAWRRTTVFAQARYDRNCGKYPTADRAQEAFLASGGPERDREGLDPDGDGFACDWSPAPFRVAVGR